MENSYYSKIFTIILKRYNTPQDTLTELERKIVAEIRLSPKISISELASKLSISSDMDNCIVCSSYSWQLSIREMRTKWVISYAVLYTIKEYLDKLKSKGAIKRVGKTSAGYWEILNG